MIMKISLLDAGEYFWGLLLLTRKDHKTAEEEVELMKRIGRTLGFEKQFCDNEMSASEVGWLKSVVQKNRRENEWLIQELAQASKRKEGHVHLEVDDFVVEHS